MMLLLVRITTSIVLRLHNATVATVTESAVLGQMLVRLEVMLLATAVMRVLLVLVYRVIAVTVVLGHNGVCV